MSAPPPLIAARAGSRPTAPIAVLMRSKSPV